MAGVIYQMLEKRIFDMHFIPPNKITVGDVSKELDRCNNAMLNQVSCDCYGVDYNALVAALADPDRYGELVPRHPRENQMVGG